MTESFGILICPSSQVMRAYALSSPFIAVVFSKTLNVYSYHVLNIRSTKHEWSLLTITFKKIRLQEIVHTDVAKVLLEPNFDLRQCILRSFKICCIVTHCNASSRGRRRFWMRPILSGRCWRIIRISRKHFKIAVTWRLENKCRDFSNYSNILLLAHDIKMIKTFSMHQGGIEPPAGRCIAA